VNAVSVAGGLVLVTNGIYAPVAVNTPLTLQSSNGPDATVIDGGGVRNCVYLTNNTTMVGFTLTNGYSRDGSGGGAYCESTSAVLTNCVLTGNSAVYSGGAANCTLNNCTLTGNSAFAIESYTFPRVHYYGGSGGGASGSILNNCTLIGNSAWVGGGAADCTLNNCTLTEKITWGGQAGKNSKRGPT